MNANELHRSLTAAALMVVGMPTTIWAGDEASKPPTSAPKAVREGNLLLKAGDAASALELYRQAEALKPSAREIAFDRGLGHYALGQFDEAREAFEKAAAGDGDELADDAVYSAGASDHAEALAKAAEPQLALSKLESAMQRYHGVLSRRPEHQAAKDANYKAASTWRMLKQQLEQQQQNDQQDQNKEGEDQKNQEQQPSQQQKEDEKKEQQSAQGQEQQKREQQSEQQQSSADDEQDKKEDQSKEAQAQQQEEKEQVSREQAERKLREMMQALRDRKKLRPEEVRKAPISPVDKDW